MKKETTKFGNTITFQSWEDYFKEIGEEFYEDYSRPLFCNATLTIGDIVEVNVYSEETQGAWHTVVEYEILNEKFKKDIDEFFKSPSTTHIRVDDEDVIRATLTICYEPALMGIIGRI